MSNKRSWITLSLGVVSSILFVLIDVTESNISASTFALPVLMMGSLIFPSLIDIIKDSKKK